MEISGQRWVRLVVVGQSFMLHQIRKMVGMAVAVARGDAPLACLQLAIKSSAGGFRGGGKRGAGAGVGALVEPPCMPSRDQALCQEARRRGPRLLARSKRLWRGALLALVVQAWALPAFRLTLPLRARQTLRRPPTHLPCPRPCRPTPPPTHPHPRSQHPHGPGAGPVPGRVFLRRVQRAVGRAARPPLAGRLPGRGGRVQGAAQGMGAGNCEQSTSRPPACVPARAWRCWRARGLRGGQPLLVGSAWVCVPFVRPQASRLYPHIAQRDGEECVNAAWLKTINDANYRFRWEAGGGGGGTTGLG
jgi:hypothetical protein